MLWRPAAAISSARLALSCPFTSLKSSAGGGSGYGGRARAAAILFLRSNVDKFCKRFRRIYGNSLGEERFARVPRRDEHCSHALAFGGENLREDALYVRNAVEREFSDEEHFFGERLEVAGGDEIGEREREIVVRALFLQIGGRERENDALILLFRRLVAGMSYRGRDTITRSSTALSASPTTEKLCNPRVRSASTTTISAPEPTGCAACVFAYPCLGSAAFAAVSLRQRGRRFYLWRIY